MRRALVAAVVLAAVLHAPAGASSATLHARPWATVNLCDPAERPGAIGVRAGVPAGPGDQWIRVRVQWYDASTGRWATAPGGDGGWLRLGDGRRGVRGGMTFTFPVPAAGRLLLLRGSVAVQWRRGGLVRKRAVRTSAGHGAHAGGSSWAQCVVPG